MKVNRKRTAESSDKTVGHGDAQVAKMSLAEFMQKGFSSDDEDELGSSCARPKVS